MERALMRAVFVLEPETAHGFALFALKTGLAPGRAGLPPPSLAQDLMGLRFPSPIGLAAGFDKNAEAPDAMLRRGFGFVEMGTVTPRPQPGNPRPRLFRLTEDQAVINRLGFNNKGHDVVEANLQRRAGRGGIVGVNLGANKDSADRIGDYVRGYERLAGYASYVAVNISSPNTPGLRDLQSGAELDELLGRMSAARAASAVKRPLLLKIAPDLNDSSIASIVEAVAAAGFEGLIVSNTTLARPETLVSRHRTEAGGLSGVPLLAPSTRALAIAHLAAKGRLVLIGAGGVAGSADALLKIEAGAHLVQLYSALIYHGPGLAGRIVRGLASALGATPISQLRGTSAAALA